MIFRKVEIIYNVWSGEKTSNGMRELILKNANVIYYGNTLLINNQIKFIKCDHMTITEFSRYFGMSFSDYGEIKKGIGCDIYLFN